MHVARARGRGLRGFPLGLVGVSKYMCDCAVLILLLVATMAGQSAKASADFLKNAVITNPTAKHTATVSIIATKGLCAVNHMNHV